MLEIKNLHALVNDKEILKGVDLNINTGEIHAIMGPNGAGKSTLTHVLGGQQNYNITKGEINFNGDDLCAMAPEERANRGLFLGFQYPVEIPGVNNAYFLRTALNSIRKYNGEQELDAMDFLSLIKQKMQLVGMDEKFLQRAINVGFSGGEKKRNEILQMLILKPKLAILDETDSGLDVDSLQVVANGINSLRSPERSMIVVTHYQRLLNYVQPDYVHIMVNGRIVKSGTKELATVIEEKGYGWIEQERLQRIA